MATDKIQSGKASLISLLDGASGVTQFGYVCKDPTTKTCRIFVVARSSSNIATNTLLAVVPSEYRPKTNVSVFGVVSTASGGINAYHGTVTADGGIYQAAGSTIREVFLTGEYLYE